MSPAAKIPGALVSRYSFTSTPLSTVEPGRLGQGDPGPDADADHHQVGRQRRAVVEPDLPLADRRRLAAEPEGDAVLLVERADEVAELRPEDLAERAVLGATTVTSSPRVRSDAATSRPMKLAPITTARFAALSRRDDRTAVRERPQIVDVRPVRARDRQADRLGAGGEEQRPVGERAAVREGHRPRRGIDRRHPRSPRIRSIRCSA